MISLSQLGAPSSPSGFGAVYSTCSTAWPLASRTGVTSAGRKGACWASRNLFTELSVAASRPRPAGTGDMSAQRSGTPGSAPAAGAPKPATSTLVQRGQRPESAEQARIDLPGGQFAAAGRRYAHVRIAQQQGTGRAPGGDIRVQAAPVGGGPVRGNDPDRHLSAPRPERGQCHWGVHAGQAAAELLPDGCRRHDHVAAERPGIPGPEYEQAACRNPLALQHRAHLRVAGDDSGRGDLPGHPRRGRGPGRCRGRDRGVAGGLSAVAPPPSQLSCRGPARR